MGSKHFLQCVATYIQLFNSEVFDLNKLNKLYYDLARDLLISSRVIVDDKSIHDTYLRWLTEALIVYYNFIFHDDTCITISLEVVTFVELSYSNKIMVIQWWDILLATIKTMVFSYGWKVDLGDRSPHSGHGYHYFVLNKYILY